ncbi:hypothetical protein C2E20_2592 [Micractinium conductrix]|uniref:Uncharacterized protein n=1 Tax=Micractinium conductrix TaxID=554055 RepID=A0A2P6VIU5_9CHLO|nr:hypothetical protein C2E20_2592 [Micractinium conductrix]|eukprot:PSC74021.1 hypothetical protein C2E20_2592 [Micractinium conductrix]
MGDSKRSGIMDGAPPPAPPGTGSNGGGGGGAGAGAGAGARTGGSAGKPPALLHNPYAPHSLVPPAAPHRLAQEDPTAAFLAAPPPPPVGARSLQAAMLPPGEQLSAASGSVSRDLLGSLFSGPSLEQRLLRRVVASMQERRCGRLPRAAALPVAPPALARLWSPYLLPAAEDQLRDIVRRKSQYSKFIALLAQRSALYAEQISALLTATPGGDQPPFLAHAPSSGGAGRPTRHAGAALAGQTRRRAELAAVAELTRQGAVARDGAARGAAQPKHDPVNCQVAACRRCAYQERLRKRKEGMAARPGQPAAQPLQKAPPKQHKAPQQRAAAGGGGGGAAAAAALHVTHPALGEQVCTAICDAVGSGGTAAAARGAMAAWLVEAGCSTPAQVAQVLDGSQQVWGMALGATNDSGAKLVHWVQLLGCCKQLAAGGGGGSGAAAGGGGRRRAA